MSAEESYGSHSLTSFAAQLELTVPQSPQMKNMAPGNRLTDTAKNLPPDVYALLKTPPHETKGDRKNRIQRITRESARKWQNYEELDKHHEESFVVNPPLKVLGIKAHAPPAPGVVPHPSSLKTHDDFPEAYTTRNMLIHDAIFRRYNVTVFNPRQSYDENPSVENEASKTESNDVLVEIFVTFTMISLSP